MSQIAAFFDIDGTLYRDNLQTELFKRLIKYGIIDPSDWHNGLEPYYKRWDNRVGQYDDYLEKMSLIYCRSIKGLKRSVLEYIAQQVIDEKGGRVYTYTRNRILWHKEQGHKVITISGSPIELVGLISQRYEFDDFRGTKYFTDINDEYTGELTPLWDSEHKQLALNEIVKKYDLDLQRCYAYGDTLGDLSMFAQAGYPTCINPTKGLISSIKSDSALMEKINIIIERKDVIYKINLDSIDLIN
ncbi:MAG TPA: HAD-IB family hydrolase [Clostridiales bacterium]|nr:MAG: haloacid dehalogenase [Clostridiales bacterium GWD2_32_19]HCC07133.1 HAD-IB family hydrolase [Clostridiales bacterium]